MLDLKDKLNLLWKFLFLVVFTYGVISLTCCKNSCQSCSNQNSAQISQCCKGKNVPVKKQCGKDCQCQSCQQKKEQQ